MKFFLSPFRFGLLFAGASAVASVTAFGAIERRAALVPADLRNPFAPPGRVIEAPKPVLSPLERALVAVRAWRVDGYVSHRGFPSRSSAVIEGRMLLVDVAVPPGEMDVDARVCLKALTPRGAELEVSVAGETAMVTLPLLSQ